MTATSVTDHHAPTGREHHPEEQESAGQDAFGTDTTGLPAGVPTPTVELSDGAVYALRIAPVTKQIGDATVRMLAYNGSVPGPTLRVRQGTEVVVNAVNDGDLETTVHWHGLRLDNRFDGTHHTQDPIETGGEFGYRISFPDPGVYWYHPHIRQDYGQEMGLYGTIVVEPTDPDYWPPVNQEVTLTLDDILLTDGAVAPFSRTQTTHAAMGRFGDVLLVNGEPALKLSARAGEVVRFYLVNTANTRVFNVAIPGARIKLVGGDSGHYEHERFVQSVVVAPSERVVIDVQFTDFGVLTLEHRTPDRVHPLAEITVTAEHITRDLSDEFAALRTNADMVAERHRITPMIDAAPQKTVAFVAEMDMDASTTEPDTAGAPHHHHDAGHMPVGDGIEWEDDMVEFNRMTTRANLRWILLDRDTGERNHGIDWRFLVGDQVKIRLVNEMDSDHPMHHPFHLHGAGRFLILSRDAAVEPNLVWKDTVLVRRGETVDIGVDISNPGVWMAHCHIAEHHESGMMLNFHVVAGAGPQSGR